MSGVELAAIVVAVVELSARVAALCLEYGSRVKNAEDAISRLQNESTSLNKTLQLLRRLLDSPNGDRLTASRNLCDAVGDCSSTLKRLGQNLEPGKGHRTMSRLGFRGALKWPLNSKDVDKIVAELERQRNAITLAVNVDQAALMLNLDQKMDDMKIALAGSYMLNQPFSTLPFDIDPDFVDRPDIMNWIKEKFDGPIGRVALVGLGGVGKSQIAIHFAHQFRKLQPDIHLFWVYGSTKPRFEESYRSIARMLQLPGLNDPNVNVLSLVRDWLQNERNGMWLVILDNADDVRVLYPKLGNTNDPSSNTPLLASFLPKTRNGKILITSRSMDAAERLTGSYKDIIKVPVMDKNQATKLFRNKLDTLCDEEATCIPGLLQALDFLPLAISQAAAYINRRADRTNISKYLDEFRESEKKSSNLLNKDSGDLRRDESVSNAVIATWKITFEQVRLEEPSAAGLLSFLSFFNHQEIPEFVLRKYDNNADLQEDLDVLNGYSLISHATRKGTWDMHSLVQLCTKAWLSSSDEVSRWKRTFLTVMSEEFPQSTFENWPICEVLYPHIASIIQNEPAEDELKDWTKLFTNTAIYLYDIGNYMQAENIGRKAVAVRIKVLGDEHPDTLTSMNHLALALDGQGKYDEARGIYRKTLELRKKVLGDEHPDTLVSMNNLASVLVMQGKYDEAERIHQKTLELRKKVLGDKHPDTLVSMNDFALTLKKLGKYDEAERIHRDNLELLKQVLGDEHPKTLKGMSNLALALDEQGKYDEAEGIHRKTLELRKKVLGDEHPDTLTSMNNLALALENRGNYDEAEQIYQKTLELWKKVLGDEHPDVLKGMNNLGFVFYKQGKYDEAEQSHRKTLELKKRVLGDEHPSTLRSMNNLALALEKREKYDEAEGIYRRALRLRKKVLGDEHPDTLTSLNNLASVLDKQGTIPASCGS